MEEKLVSNIEAVALPIDSIIVGPIGVDLFYSESGIESSLPEHILQNPVFIEQAAERRALFSAFDGIFTKMPDPRTEIGEALENGTIEPQEVASLYDDISNFLTADENNRRLLLYLPFEILPNLNNPDTLPEDVLKSGQRLGKAYKNAWITLLFEVEPRASFIDGDVLEPGLGEPERISKAGHLTPELLAKGIIKTFDVIELLEIIPNEEIVRSLAQGTVVARDRGLISNLEWEKIRTIIEAKIGGLDNLSEKRNLRVATGPISPERERWLKKVAEEERINQEAAQIAQEITDGLSLSTLQERGGNLKVKVLGIIKAGVHFAQTDQDRVGQFSADSEGLFTSFWSLKDPEIEDAIISGFSHWARLGIIDNQFLQRFGIKLTDLSLPSQFDNDGLLEEFGDLANAAKKIQEHPVLSETLYPAFLVFGSRIKGYADAKADFDIAMFFRPGVRFEDREQILDTLKRDVPEVGNIDKILEYWTMLQDGKLSFKTPREDTRAMVGEAQVHFFLGGVWIGNGEEFMQIRRDMIERYLDLSRFGEQKEEVRMRLLGQIELDVLQYRLLHKGYRKLYPPIKRARTQNSDLIDWESDFWDQGYRRIATKLFLSRVFLPTLS